MLSLLFSFMQTSIINILLEKLPEFMFDRLVFQDSTEFKPFYVIFLLHYFF